jgi:hypothetical protein
MSIHDDVDHNALIRISIIGFKIHFEIIAIQFGDHCFAVDIEPERSCRGRLP